MHAATALRALLLGLAILAAAPAARAETRLAILPVRSDSVAKAKLQLLGDSFTTAADDMFSLRVLGPAEVRELLNPAQERLAGSCDNAFCWTRLGKTLEANAVIAVKATGVDDQILLSLKVVDVGGKRIVARHQQPVRNDILTYLEDSKRVLAALRGKLPSGLQDLMDGKAPPPLPPPAKKKEPEKVAKAEPAKKEEKKPAPDPGKAATDAEKAMKKAVGFPEQKQKPAEPPKLANPGYLGMKHRTIDAATGVVLEMPVPKGTLVEKLKPSGPAEKGGLKSGDVITGFNGRPVDSASGLQRFLDRAKPGTPVTFTVWRNSREKKITVILGERKKK